MIKDTFMVIAIFLSILLEDLISRISDLIHSWLFVTILLSIIVIMSLAASLWDYFIDKKRKSKTIWPEENAESISSRANLKVSYDQIDKGRLIWQDNQLIFIPVSGNAIIIDGKEISAVIIDYWLNFLPSYMRICKKNGEAIKIYIDFPYFWKKEILRDINL